MLISDIPILLASQSPRRSELLKQMDFNFETKVRDVDETFDPNLSPHDAVKFIVDQKLTAFAEESQNYVVICADTIVAIDREILGKPKNLQEAKNYLELLSGKEHQVVTGVGFSYLGEKHAFLDETQVKFRILKENEIDYYLAKYYPLDKAGAYGIQEWIGHIGIEEISGSYTNVMGLPTQKLFLEIQKFMARF